MRKIPRGLAFAGALLLLVVSLSGCTVASSAWLWPQSHFDYPNSNVVPIGRVQAEVSGGMSLYPSAMDADLMEQVIQDALKQKGGDILLDYTLTTIIKMYPIVFLNLYETTYRVDGTAAKMEIGKKMLR